MKNDLSRIDTEIKRMESVLAELKQQRALVANTIHLLEGKQLSVRAAGRRIPITLANAVADSQPAQSKANRRKAHTGNLPTKKTSSKKRIAIDYEKVVEAILNGCETPSAIRAAIGIGEGHSGVWRKFATKLKKDKRITNQGSGNNTRFVPVSPVTKGRL